MIVSTERGEEKKKNPHWFDFHGPPTPFPMITPGLIPIQKDNKKPKSKQPQLLRSWGSRE